jgi:glycosyltransferase involved in cell wall biosynthesis
MKFAFVSQALPPSWSGQAVVIHRLLNGLNPDDYCLISQDYGENREHRKKPGRLLGKCYDLPRRFVIKHGWRFGFIRRINILLRGLMIAGIIKREGCKAIAACPGDFYDLPSAYLASRLTKVGFYPYMLDFYSQQSVGFKSEASARRLEATMMRGAAGIIVPNEFMGDELRRRYGVDSVIIRNPCEVSKYEELPSPGMIDSNGEIKIIYTGSIYAAHYDAFRNLVAAIEKLDRWSIRLHLYTNEPPEGLEKKGIRGPVVHHGVQELSAIPNIQRAADILFLPLAFDSPFPALVRTSAPGKTGEYLAAARPILVHVPPDSFLAWYFRRHECGLVVDEDDPVKLAEAIERIIVSPELQQKLSTAAWERAQEEFSIPASQSAFARFMKLGDRSSGIMSTGIVYK